MVFIVDWSYITGFFDADGNGMIYKKPNKRVWLTWSNTLPNVIFEIKKFVGKGFIWSQKKRECKHCKTLYNLRIGNHYDVLEVAKKMLPYAIVKKKILKEIIEFTENEKWARIGILRNLTKKELGKLYWEKKMSMQMIAKKFNVQENSIRTKMIKFNIPIRNRSQAARLIYERTGVMTS